MNTTSRVQFNQTEEAFFLSCVDEVIQGWASQSGKANLNISVENGKADIFIFTSDRPVICNTILLLSL